MILSLIYALFCVLRFNYVFSSSLFDRDYIDGAFNNEKMEIQLIRDQWIWTYSNNRLGKQSIKDKPITSAIKAINVKSADLKAKILMPRLCIREACRRVLMRLFLTNDNKIYYEIHGASNTKELIDSPNTLRILGLGKAYGTVDSGQSLWPSYMFDSNYNKHLPIVYYSRKSRMITINNRNKVIEWKSLNESQWKDSQISNLWTYVGLFIKDGYVYSVAINGTHSSKVFKLVDTTLTDTGKNIKQFFHSGTSTLVIIVIVVVVIVILTIIGLALAYIFIRRNKVNSLSLSKSKSKEKSNVELQPQFGDLDSHLDIDMKISNISSKPLKNENKTKEKSKKEKSIKNKTDEKNIKTKPTIPSKPTTLLTPTRRL